MSFPGLCGNVAMLVLNHGATNVAFTQRPVEDEAPFTMVLEQKPIWS
jgi:hypothetical protein